MWVGPSDDLLVDCEKLALLTSRALGEVSKGLFSLILAEAVFLVRGPCGARLQGLATKEHAQPKLMSKDTTPIMPGQGRNGHIHNIVKRVVEDLHPTASKPLMRTIGACYTTGMVRVLTTRALSTSDH